MYCNILYPISKSAWGYFPNNVVSAIQICIDQLASGAAEHSSVNTATHVGFVVANRLKIKKRAFRRMTLFCQNNVDAYKFALVSQHFDKPGVRNGDKVLVVALANANTLFPSVILADNQYADLVLDQEIDNAPAGRMQVMVNTPRSLVGHAFDPKRSVPIAAQLTLEFCLALVVELVDGLQRATVNDYGLKTRFVCSYHREVVQTNIYASDQGVVQIGRFCFCFINDLNHVMGLLHNNAGLLHIVVLQIKLDIQSRQLELTLLQSRSANGLNVVANKISAICLVFVLRQTGSTCEGRRVSRPFFSSRMERLPVPQELPEHIVRDFSGQTLVGIAVLHFGIQRLHAQSDTFLDERLTDQIVRSVVQILRRKRHRIYLAPCGVATGYHMPLNKFHVDARLKKCPEASLITGLQLLRYFFCLSLRSPLTVKPDTKAIYNGREVVDEVFLAVVRKVDNLDPSALESKEMDLDG